MSEIVTLFLKSVKKNFKYSENELKKLMLGPKLKDRQTVAIFCIRPSSAENRLFQDCLIYKVGMSLEIQLELARKDQNINLDRLDSKREEILRELRQTYDFIDLTYIY